MLYNADSFNLNYTFRLKGMLSWEEKKNVLFIQKIYKVLVKLVLSK